MALSLSQRPMLMVILTIHSVNYQESIVQLALPIQRNKFFGRIHL